MKTDQEIDLIQLLMDQISTGILFVDSRGSIAVANRAAETLLNLSREYLIETPITQIFQEEKLGFSPLKALNGGDFPQQTYLELDSATLEIRTTAAVDERRNQIIGLILMLSDVTKTRQLEAQISRNSRLEDLENITSIISHDLKNPLGGIKGFASLLLRELEEGTKSHEMAKKICQGADDLSNTLQKIVDYFKERNLELKEEEVGTLISEVVDLLQKDKKFKNRIKIAWDQPDQKIFADIDRAQIHSALTHLLVNAAEAMEENETIQIGLNQKGRDILITVKDDGPGMDDETKRKIFRPRFTTKEEKSGIGLAEVKHIIDSHQGTITITTTLGKGTKFTIILPRTHEN